MKNKKELEKIARLWLGVETLETRRSGDQDFYECAVWCIKDALEEAYKLGQKSVVE